MDTTIKGPANIIADLYTDVPAYLDHDISSCNGTGKYIESLRKSRKSGLQAFERKLQSIKETDKTLYEKLTTIPNKRERVATPSFDVPALPEEVAKIEEQAYSEFFAEYEHYSKLRSPRGYKDYHAACACWLLSTVAARRVYAQHAGMEFYTPFMVALIGRSTYTAKSKTAHVATDILKKAGLKWLLGPDETTPQKMLSSMAGHIPPNWSELSPEKQETAKNRLAMSGQRGWFYDEFGQLMQSMMQVNSPMSEFSGLLRRMDECQDSYTYDTRSYGEESIDNPYLSLLATLTPTDVAQQAKKHANMWNNGFWARFMIVTPPANEYGSGYCPDELPEPTRLVEMLQAWHGRLKMPEIEVTYNEESKKNTLQRYTDLPSHQCKMTEEALRVSRRYEQAVLDTNKANGIQDLDSSIGRLMDKAMRIATLIASLENDGIIDLPQWAMGQKIAEMARRNLYELYFQVNETPDDNQEKEDMLLDWLETQPKEPMTIRQMQQKAPAPIRRLGSKGIEEIINSLLKISDALTLVSIPGKKAKYYQLSVASVAESVAR